MAGRIFRTHAPDVPLERLVRVLINQSTPKCAYSTRAKRNRILQYIIRIRILASTEVPSKSR